MDLLRTLLLYMTMIYASSVQNAPDAEAVLQAMATPTPVVEETPTPSPVPTATPTPVPTIDISPNPEYKTLQVGDKGDEVLRLQQALTDYGFYEGDIDGRYGNQTRRAVELFQYFHGLVADGIAGKNTLTVLYDSNQVRYAKPTPSPTPELKLLSAALTPAPSTPAPTEVPTATPGQTETPAPDETPEAADPQAVAETAAPADTPAPTEAPIPSPTPEPDFLPMEGWTILIDGKAQPLSATDGETTAPVLPYVKGDYVYVPLLQILLENDVLVVPSDNLERMEYAFVIGSDVYLISYTETQEGKPTDLTVYKNTEPQILPVRDLDAVDGTVYLPAQSIMSLTGIGFELDEEAKTVTVLLPELMQMEG